MSSETLLELVSFVIPMHLSSFGNRLLSLSRLLKMDWGLCTDTYSLRLHLVYGRIAFFHAFLRLESVKRAVVASSYFNLLDQKLLLPLICFNYIKLCSFCELWVLELIYGQGSIWVFLTYTNLLLTWCVRETFRFYWSDWCCRHCKSDIDGSDGVLNVLFVFRCLRQFLALIRFSRIDDWCTYHMTGPDCS